MGVREVLHTKTRMYAGACVCTRAHRCLRACAVTSCRCSRLPMPARQAQGPAATGCARQQQCLCPIHVQACTHALPPHACARARPRAPVAGSGSGSLMSASSRWPSSHSMAASTPELDTATAARLRYSSTGTASVRRYRCGQGAVKARSRCGACVLRCCSVVPHTGYAEAGNDPPQKRGTG